MAIADDDMLEIESVELTMVGRTLERLDEAVEALGARSRT